MPARLTFLAVAAFWVTMNVFLWRMEFGLRGGDTPVPAQLVWRKILSAPDSSSLSVYQKGERMGFCELSTGVGQQMATLDENKLPPEGLAAHLSYQLHLAGNVAMDDFTNRLKFDGRAKFDHQRQWTEFSLKITSRLAVIDIHAQATNQTAHIRLTNEGVILLERDAAFSDLQDPGAIVRALAGSSAGDFWSVFDVADILPDAGGQRIEWDTRRTRIKIGAETVPVYQLETSVLGHVITVDVSTLGEILSVKLPDSIVAQIDDLNKP